MSYSPTTAELALSALKQAGRPMTGGELFASGVHRMALTRLVRAGVLERVARGVYRSAKFDVNEESEFSAWAWASLRNPELVFCLESAAAYHRLTQGMAPQLNIAVSLDSKGGSPELTSYIGTRYFRWADEYLTVGVDTVLIEGVEVKITSPERTVVDMFRYSSSAPSSVRTSRMIETEAFHDCLLRFFEGQDDPGQGMRKLRKVAKPLGLWDNKMKPQIELVAMTVGREFSR